MCLLPSCGNLISVQLVIKKSWSDIGIFFFLTSTFSMSNKSKRMNDLDWKSKSGFLFLTGLSSLVISANSLHRKQSSETHTFLSHPSAGLTGTGRVSQNSRLSEVGRGQETRIVEESEGAWPCDGLMLLQPFSELVFQVCWGGSNWFNGATMGWVRSLVWGWRS